MDGDVSVHDAEAGAKSDPDPASVPPYLAGPPRTFTDSLATFADIPAPDAAHLSSYHDESLGAESDDAVALLARQTRLALTPRPPQRPLRLLKMPRELLLYLLQYLDFADIMRLRRTCRLLRELASPHQMRVLLGARALHATLLRHCRVCLAHDPSRASLLMTKPSDSGFPFASRCVECALLARDPRMQPGTKLLMANYQSVWVCRWCCRPIMGGMPVNQDQFHRSCNRTYQLTQLFFFGLGLVQFGLSITAVALAWQYFRTYALVFAPSLASFILFIYCMMHIFFRSSKRVSYHCAAVLEFIAMALWIPPAYSIVKGTTDANPGQPWPSSTVATLVMISLLILFRFLNFLGNVVLLFGYRISNNHQPQQPWWRKMLVNPIMMLLIAWTHPQSVEQKSPPFYQ